MTIKKKILRALSDAPATSAELGAILFPKMSMRDSMRRCSAHCCYLRTDGVLEVVGQVDLYGNPNSPIKSNLYRISRSKPKTKERTNG